MNEIITILKIFLLLFVPKKHLKYISKYAMPIKKSYPAIQAWHTKQ